MMNSIHGLVPGDKVKVRSWNSMKNENGVALHGITCGGVVFVEEMKRYCGEYLVIRGINCSGSLSLSGGGTWSYSANMLIFKNG